MFKDKLKELREKEGLSQQALADKLFVSRSAIAKWENGNGIPSDVNLSEICKFFDVEEEWILDRNELKETIKIVDNKISNMNIVFFSMICFILLFCLFIGGDYWLHRIAILFTIIYMFCKFIFKDSKLNRIICMISLVISIVISLVNWLATSVAEPSNFLRFTEIASSINGLNLMLSQLSSILNILMLLGVHTIFLIVNKKDKKTIASSIIVSLWNIIDIFCLIIPIVLIVLTFSMSVDRCFDGICFEVVSFFRISDQLGLFTIIPVFIYSFTIFLSIIDMIINARIVNNNKTKIIKILLISFFALSCITMPICWYLSSPLNSPFFNKSCLYCE